MKIRLNTPRFKGEYDFDVFDEPPTYEEWRWIKKISGYMPLTYDDGLRGGDPDLFVAFAVVALYRAGKIREDDVLETARMFDKLDQTSAITFTSVMEGADDDPPEEPAETPATETQNGNTGRSGNQTSAPSESVPKTSGVHV